MKTEDKLDKFRNEILHLIRSAEKKYGEAPGTESQSRRYHDSYQAAASNILKRFIEPRMEIAADQFDDASLDVNADAGYARLSFLHKELPAVIYLLFCLQLDYSARMIRLSAEACLTPFSFSYEPSAHLVVSLNDCDSKKIESFIEDQILTFVKGYMRTLHYAANQPEEFL